MTDLFLLGMGLCGDCLCGLQCGPVFRGAIQPLRVAQPLPLQPRSRRPTQQLQHAQQPLVHHRLPHAER